MSKLFPTQEVGSLMRAPFLKKQIDDVAVQEAEYWGKLLQVERYEELVEKLRSKRVEPMSAELYDWASLYGIRFFESAGLDVVWDGEQRRVEMYEYPMSKVDGVVFLGRVKVWDAETYNKAAIVSEPSLREYIHIDEFNFVKRHARREVKIPITGPYTLADWSFDEYYVKRYEGEEDLVERRRRSRRDMVLDLAEKIVRPIVRKLREAGANRIQIDEPAATTKPEEVELFVEAFNTVAEGIDAIFTIHICYSDYSRLFPHILEAKVHQLSIECANRDTVQQGQDQEARRGYGILKMFREYGAEMQIALGVIDVHTDFIEPPALVRDRLLYASRILDDPSRVIACNDCGLRTRRWEVAYKKEQSLVEGAELARKEVGG